MRPSLDLALALQRDVLKIDPGRLSEAAPGIQNIELIFLLWHRAGTPCWRWSFAFTIRRSRATFPAKTLRPS